MSTTEVLDTLIGKTIINISGLEEESEEVVITTRSSDGVTELHTFWHEVGCCEEVWLEDFEKPTANGGLIISAELSTEINKGCNNETWSFYKIETTKGELFMRWYGASNGYYSEEVAYRVDLVKDKFKPLH